MATEAGETNVGELTGVFAPHVDQAKVIKDSLHGDVTLHPLLVAIVDTPQFQRLRFIRQLGPVEFVYPGAVHTRFQHCIGVAHLAGVFLRKLWENDRKLPLDARDVLSVQAAALLHDLGHGPYSQTFTGCFLPQALPDLHLQHEELSVRMFHHLYESNEHVREAFRRYGLKPEDKTFIEELILPDKQRLAAIMGQRWPRTDNGVWPFEGRGPEKAFLYEIVSNKLTGVDVDKFDQLARDALHLGLEYSFDHMRYINFCRVLPDENGTRRIATRDTEVGCLADFYQQIFRLHVAAYQHKTVLIIQEMIAEALLKANDNFLIPSREVDEVGKAKMLKISQCVDDMSAYELLTDDIVSGIRLSTRPELMEAKSILDDIYSRRIFAFVGYARSRRQFNYADCAKIRLQVASLLPSVMHEMSTKSDSETGLTAERGCSPPMDQWDMRFPDFKGASTLKSDDFLVFPTKMMYNVEEQRRQLDEMRFYCKEKPEKSFKLIISINLSSSVFFEQLLYVYVKYNTVPIQRELASSCFRNWCRNNPDIADQARQVYMRPFA